MDLTPGKWKTRLRQTVRHSKPELAAGALFVLLSSVALFFPREIPLPLEVSAGLFGFGLALFYDAYSKAELKAAMASLQVSISHVRSGLQRMDKREEAIESIRESNSYLLGRDLARALAEIRTRRTGPAPPGARGSALGRASLLDLREEVEYTCSGWEKLVRLHEKVHAGDVVADLAPLESSLPSALAETKETVRGRYGERVEAAFWAGAVVSIIKDHPPSRSASVPTPAGPAANAEVGSQLLQCLQVLGVEGSLVRLTKSVLAHEDPAPSLFVPTYVAALDLGIEGYLQKGNRTERHRSKDSQVLYARLVEFSKKHGAADDQVGEQFVLEAQGWGFSPLGGVAAPEP